MSTHSWVVGTKTLVPFSNGSQCLWRTQGTVPKGVKVKNCDQYVQNTSGDKGDRVWETGLAARGRLEQRSSKQSDLSKVTTKIIPRKYKPDSTLIVMPHWLACLGRKKKYVLYGCEDLNKPEICLAMLYFFFLFIWSHLGKGRGSGNEGKVLDIRLWMGLVGSL